MPLPIAHGLLGASIAAAIHPEPSKRYYLPLFVGGFLANAADFDFALVFILGSKEWHRGFSHSILFAFVVVVCFLVYYRRSGYKQALAYGLAYASHVFLDFATTKKGGGSELLFPFSADRFGWRFWGLSEMPSALPVIEILKTLVLETVIFAPLLLFVLYLRNFLAKTERGSLS